MRPLRGVVDIVDAVVIRLVGKQLMAEYIALRCRGKQFADELFLFLQRQVVVTGATAQ